MSAVCTVLLWTCCCVLSAAWLYNAPFAMGNVLRHVYGLGLRFDL
jgi:hypothetical protein